MLFNYLKTALRAARRQALLYSLNVFSLSVGCIAIVLMSLYVAYEFSYDTFWPNSDSVYRVEVHDKSKGTYSPYINAKLAERFTNIAGVTSVYQLAPMDDWFWFDSKVKVAEQQFKLNKTVAATKNIAELFPLNMLHGKLSNALNEPNNIVLSRTEALRLFGATNVLGARLERASSTLIVSGVFDDLAQNSHLDFRAIVPLSEKYLSYVKSYHDDTYVYLRLTPQVTNESIGSALANILSARQERNEPNINAKLNVMTDIHLQGTGVGEMKKGGSLETVFICMAVCLILSMVTGVNFVNMSVAAASKRSKEIGIKKALGVKRVQLVAQFMLESLLLVALSIFISLGICEQLLPWFNNFVGRDISFTSLWPVVAIISSVVLVLGMILGSYPAVVIAKQSTTFLLSGAFESGRQATKVKSLLLVMQASCSIALIIGSLNLHKQLTHLSSLPVGYDTVSRLYIPQLDRSTFTKDSVLLQKIIALPEVKTATHVDNDLTKEVAISMGIKWPSGPVVGEEVYFSGTGYQASEVLGLTLLAGRDFSRQFASDWYQKRDSGDYSAAVMVTGSLAKKLGYTATADAIGKTFSNVDAGRMTHFTIVGVVDDLKIGSVRQASKPMFFVCGLSWTGKSAMQLVVNKGSEVQLIETINRLVEKQLQIADVDTQRLSDNYSAIYQKEQFTGRVIVLFTMLAIMLSCLGVFALSAYGVRARQKEVAVRKVLGATSFSLINLLAREYMWLVCISTVIAYPITYWVISDWLANFNERIDQALWVYVFAGLSVAVITWLTVASLAFKTASTRPSLILRDE